MDLIHFIQNYLTTPSKSVATRTGGSSLAVPGRDLVRSGPTIIDGEWSEVPKGLSSGGSVYSPGRGLQRTYGEFSEVPKAISGARGALARLAQAGASGGIGGMINPLLAAVMGSTQGDVLNNYHGYFSHVPEQQTAYPQGQVTSAPLPPAQSLPTQPMPPVQGLDMTAHVPLPQPRPHVPMPMPNPGVNPNGSIRGAVGPTSVGGAPLVQPQAAPVNPGMSFFQRNAAMMRDPITGQLIDPAGAARANGSGLIDKMMGYLHKKADSQPGYGGPDPSQMGSG